MRGKNGKDIKPSDKLTDIDIYEIQKLYNCVITNKIQRAKIGFNF